MDRPPSPPTADLLYGLDDRPPVIRTLLYGVQWLLIFLPNLTVFSVLLADILGLDPVARAALFQRMLLITGAIMIIQTRWGHQLPLLDGPSLALVITVPPLAASGPGAIAGGMILGGFLLFLCGALGWMRILTGLFSDRVIGVILLLISLTVLPYLVPMLLGADAAHPHGRPTVFFLGLGLVLVMAVTFHYFRGLLRSLSIFWGIALGTGVFAALGLLDFSGTSTTAWLSWPRQPDWNPWPRFDLAAVISFALAYLAVLVNAMGSLYSLEPILNPEAMPRRLNRGLAVTGLSGMLSGAAGVIGTVPYSLSPGVITVTRVGSRHAVTACGLLLAALAFLGKLTAILSAIPEAVVAAALIGAIGAQVGVALNIIHRDGDRLGGRDYLIIGVPVILGAMASLLPPAFLNLLPASLRPILGNGLIVGVVLVLLLEHVLLREKESDR